MTGRHRWKKALKRNPYVFIWTPKQDWVRLFFVDDDDFILQRFDGKPITK